VIPVFLQRQCQPLKPRTVERMSLDPTVLISRTKP
jgi:hypothetical protein